MGVEPQGSWLLGGMLDVAHLTDHIQRATFGFLENPSDIVS
jgi:hypothetical protein